MTCDYIQVRSRIDILSSHDLWERKYYLLNTGLEYILTVLQTSAS